MSQSSSKSPSKSSGAFIKSPSRKSSAKLDALVDSLSQMSVDLQPSDDPTLDPPASTSSTSPTRVTLGKIGGIGEIGGITSIGTIPTTNISPSSTTSSIITSPIKIKPVGSSSIPQGAGVGPTLGMSSSSAPLKIVTKKTSSLHLPKLPVASIPPIARSSIATPVPETEPLPETRPFKRVVEPILTLENVGNIELPEGVTIMEPIAITIPREQLTEVNISPQQVPSAPSVRSRADILRNIDKSRLVVSTAGQTKSYKVEELKGFFKMLGEAPKGNKPELVAKLQQMIEESGI